MLPLYISAQDGKMTLNIIYAKGANKNPINIYFDNSCMRKLVKPSNSKKIIIYINHSLNHSALFFETGEGNRNIGVDQVTNGMNLIIERYIINPMSNRIKINVVGNIMEVKNNLRAELLVEKDKASIEFFLQNNKIDINFNTLNQSLDSSKHVIFLLKVSGYYPRIIRANVDSRERIDNRINIRLNLGNVELFPIDSIRIATRPSHSTAIFPDRSQMTTPLKILPDNCSPYHKIGRASCRERV